MIEFKTRKPRISINFNDPNEIEITFTANRNQAPEIESLKEDKEIIVQVKEYVKKRSVSQNSYMWVLLDEIARKVGHTKEEIYRVYIKDYGVFEILPIRADALNEFKKKWEKNGTGWITQELGESKIDGYINLIAYFGSSTYNTKEMSRLIDAIIRDCEELGINTMTKDEILSLYNENDK